MVGHLPPDRYRQSLAVAAPGPGRAGFALHGDHRHPRADGCRSRRAKSSPYPGEPSPGGWNRRARRWKAASSSSTISTKNGGLEFAPGFHTSRTHAAGFSIPSQLFSLDWFFNPHRRRWNSPAHFTPAKTWRRWETAFSRASPSTTAGLDAVDSIGGWGQITVHAAPPLDLHLFTGQQDDQDHDLIAGRIGKNLLYGGNLYYRLAPNVLLGLEATQVRTTYIGQGLRINNHYDLALAYHF